MKNFDQLTDSMAQSRGRRGALTKFGASLAGLALTGWLALPAAADEPAEGTSTVVDAAGDAVFPFDLYDGPVPPYLDVVQASVSLSRGVFHFEIKVNSDIPANADPGLNPSVNHLGVTFGIATDQVAESQTYKFFGQRDLYRFNLLVGALYSVEDSGVGLELGWSGFIISSDGVAEIPLRIKQDTFIFEVSAAALGNPTSFDWAVGSECDPVPAPDESNRTTVLVDFVPDQGVASWSPLGD